MPIRRRIVRILLVASISVWGPAAAAHEYWIDPVEFRLPAGEAILGDLRLGEDFKGSRYPYLPQKSVGAWIVDGDGKRPWRAFTGDLPALSEKPGPEGLHVIAYHSTASRLTYSESGKFAKFVDGQGLDGVLEAHRERGLAETGFDEAYTRCAKALVQSGGGGGDDAPVGLPLELVAGANPYELPDDATELPVSLLWQGSPLADAQITIFRKGEDVEQTTVRTDADGRAVIPLGTGGRFLLNAVHMIPWDEKPKDAWHSYWASLTFAIEQ